MRHDDVAAVARAIADRQAVDWESLQSTGDADWRDAIGQLKVIADIDALHHNPGTRVGRTGWGPFRIIELVGHGTHGDVFRAIDTRLDREVALKLLRTGEAAAEEVATAPETTR